MKLKFSEATLSAMLTYSSSKQKGIHRKCPWILLFHGSRQMPDYSISHQHKLTSTWLYMKNERFHEPTRSHSLLLIMSSFSAFYTNQMKISDAIFERQILYSCMLIKNVRRNRERQVDNLRVLKVMKGTQRKAHSQVIQINSNMCLSYSKAQDHNALSDRFTTC